MHTLKERFKQIAFFCKSFFVKPKVTRNQSITTKSKKFC